jgi:putative transposase
VTSKNCCQQEALPSVTKLSEIGVISSGKYCSKIRKSRGQLGDTWYLDKVFIKINGAVHYLWRAVNQNGDEIDILLQKCRDKKAAIRKLLKGQQAAPIKIITDNLKTYSAA